MRKADYIGKRGEAIAFASHAQIVRADAELPYFRPHYLGKKCEVFDFLVELIDAGEKTPFFFVQVRATRKSFTKKQKPSVFGWRYWRQRFVAWSLTPPRPTSLA